MKLDIISVPNPILRKQSTKIKKIDRKTQEFILDLGETLKKAKNPEGVGLSAPQVGKNIRAFVTYLDHQLKTYINPTILDQSTETTLGNNPEKPILEGCLSIPHLYGPVYRAETIKIKSLDLKGQQFTQDLKDFPARVFLHELDHLKGILFTDYTIKDDLPLYLNQNDEFRQIHNPKDLINW